MIQFLLLGLLVMPAIWAHPVKQLGDVASHIVIVTPQAQVHLEPALKYEAPATFIHHLAPLARFAAPSRHEETIVYVPASAAAPLLPLDATHVVARSDGGALYSATGSQSKQYEQIASGISNIQMAIQEGANAIGPQLSEAAGEASSQAAAAANAAGSSFFPSLFPPAAATATATAQPANALPKKVEGETPANTKPLIPAAAIDGRRFYALAPAVPHIVDFVHSPVFGPVSALRARSIPEGEAPVIAIALPETPSAAAAADDALPLKAAPLPETEALAEAVAAAEPEKKSAIGRNVNAFAGRDESEKEEKRDELDKQRDAPLSSSSSGENETGFAQPQSKSNVVVDYSDIVVPVVPKVVDDPALPSPSDKVV